MAGATSIEVNESLDELAEQLRQAKTPTDKERLQVLYWLKQENAPSISAIAKAIGKHRNTLQSWLAMYRVGGVAAMLELKKSPGGVRVIPEWAEAALAKRLQEPEHGFQSYGAVQQWLAESLGIEAEYHAVYQMSRYRLKAKLKVARPQNCKQDSEQPEAFKKTLQTTSTCSASTLVKCDRMSERFATLRLMRAASDRRRSVSGSAQNVDWTIDYCLRCQTDGTVAMAIQGVLALWCG